MPACFHILMQIHKSLGAISVGRAPAAAVGLEVMERFISLATPCHLRQNEHYSQEPMRWRRE